ncbi:non-homologous end-joining DNA ligase [Peribacillus sp. SCS-155]|uniref:non-homologous end-joining DNA ligase n=1 Tax=Peribacillus sedimenti TaxID=3115297 RepID=UPI0039059792
MEPIFPMEPESSVTIPGGEGWVAQIKWDGVRVLTYSDDERVRLFNRKKNERTMHYPEITNVQSYCKQSSVILDGEVISLGENGKPAFHEVMKRDGIRRLDRVKLVAESVPIVYMIFDVLYLNGNWLNTRPFRERNNILSEIITPNDHIQLVPSVCEAGALFHAIKEQGMEGIVMKRNDSPYVIGKKKDYWVKVKNYRDIIAVIGGFTLRHNIVSAILLGLYDEKGKLQYVGHTGTGKMTDQEWRELAELLKPMVIREHPFAKKPERHGDYYWVRPEMTVKVKFAEWTEGGAMRQPSIEGFIQISPHECRLIRG